MAGFVPGRDRVTQDALMPEEARRTHERDEAARQAELDRAELAELEHEADAQSAHAPEHKGLVDRLLGR
jgi:hypothetical protein